MKKALIVEDSKIIANYIKKILSGLGYSCVISVSKTEVLDFLTKLKPQIITISGEVRDASGLDVCKSIRKQPGFQNIPIVIISSYYDEKMRIDAFDAGATAFVEKNQAAEYLTYVIKNISDTVIWYSDRNFEAYILDDSKFQRDYVSKLLERLGVKPSAFSEAESFFKSLDSRASKPDLFIIDHNIHNSYTGADIVKELKKDIELNKIPILIVTSDTDKNIMKLYFQLGIGDFIQKPFEVEEFYLRVQTHLNLKAFLDDAVKTANTDYLTKLFNRKYFFEKIANITQDKKLSIILFDIDKFKNINDTYGHDAGDDVLVIVSEEIRKNIGDDCIEARYGGEEFIVAVLGSLKSQAKDLAESLRVSLENTNIKSINKNITCSFGVADMTEASGVYDTISLADKRLYKAKENGRNRVVFQ